MQSRTGCANLDMGSKGRRNDTAPFDPVAEGAMPPVVPTPQRRSTDISLAKSDIKDLDHDGHGRQVSANPLPPTAAKPSNTRVELQDQTNFLPFRQLLLVFAGLSMAMGCPMLDQTMYVLRFSC